MDRQDGPEYSPVRRTGGQKVQGHGSRMVDQDRRLKGKFFGQFANGFIRYGEKAEVRFLQVLPFRFPPGFDLIGQAEGTLSVSSIDGGYGMSGLKKALGNKPGYVSGSDNLHVHDK